ncbi:MAG: RNA-binding domain-containing protein [Ferruginibacter sp.]
MRQIEKILSEVEVCIDKNIFKKLEHDKLELKDNSHDSSKWKEIYETSCAFLNTNGGIIIVGIKEDEINQKFIITGFDKKNENKTKEIKNIFKDKFGKNLDLSLYFPDFEINKILDKEVLVIYIDPVPEELKYIYFENTPYERIITRDYTIPKNKIEAQENYKVELLNAKELHPVVNTALSDLNVNKLNGYIHILNRDFVMEVIKPDIESAKSFLVRKGFVTKLNFQPTVLGALVCANNIGDLLGNKAEIDCYVDTGLKIAENKKILIDNILDLMEKALNFITQNIQVGVSVEAGGTGVPEYPIRLIRESINNSLAHRDYQIAKFTNVNIVPNKHIEIRNPGRFKSELKIEDFNNPIPVRRIIPGNSKPNNPRLADVLKVFDRLEGKGLGMSTLTNECLSNNVDLPYYKFHSSDELSLYIRKGKLLDEKMESLINAYQGFIEKKLNGNSITIQEKLVLSYFYKSEIENKNERYTILLTKDNNHLAAINTLEDNGLIYKHSASTDLHSVYVINRELFKSNFISELRDLFGADYDALPKDGRDVLSCIYEFNRHAKGKYQFPNANIIGDYLWSKAGNANVLNGFEGFKRAVRGHVNKMVKRNVIVKVDGKPLYKINIKFVKRPSLYDDEI